MCGIFGYIGNEPCVDLIISGLKLLEYRGYDSSGIAVMSSSGIKVCKQKGKLTELKKKVSELPSSATIGLGHTRWATHGSPNQINAHPHKVGNLALIHNGIIENYTELRNQLNDRFPITSDTDSEIIAHHLEHRIQNDKTAIHAAIRDTSAKLVGSFALAFVTEADPDAIYLLKKGSPLAIGIGESQCYFSSDAGALGEHTKKVIFLEDGEWARVETTGCKVYDFDGMPVQKHPVILDEHMIQTGKQGFRHFMLKEIFEQPSVIAGTLQRLVDFDSLEFIEDKIDNNNIDMKDCRAIYIVACGTAYYAGFAAKYMMEQLLKIPVTVEHASEFRYRKPLLNENSLIIAISQSGETADTLASIKYASEHGSRVFAVCNSLYSSISRESDALLYMEAGAEVGVASTKAFTCQLLCLYLWSLYQAKTLETVDLDELKETLLELHKLPINITTAVESESKIKELVNQYYEHPNFIYIGRGINYPIALEGALKLKEISYIHAEGFASGELKHGPLALVDHHMPIVAIIPEDQYFEKNLSNVAEIHAREGDIIAITSSQNQELAHFSSNRIYVPKAEDPVAQAIINTVPVQLLAYFIAVKLGTDVDQPRNLAKAVTVE